MLAKLHHILHLLRNPDTSVVTQGLRHKGQLALLLAVHRNTCRVNLSEARICEICSLLVALPCGRAVAVHGVGGKEVGVAIATCGDHNGMGTESLKLAGHEVAGDDTLCLSVDDDEVKHLVARITGHGSSGDLAVESRIGTQKELLTGLSTGIERTTYLNTSE